MTPRDQASRSAGRRRAAAGTWRSRLVRLARRVGRAASWLPLIAIGLGSLVATIEVLRLGAVPSWLLALLPIDLSGLDRIQAAASALTLAALGMALARRKAIAWWLAGLTLVAGMSWALVSDDGLSAVIAGLCLAGLAARRPSYRVRGPRLAGRALVAAVAVGVAVAGALALGGAAGGSPVGFGDIVAGWLTGAERHPVARLAGGAGVIAWLFVSLRVAVGLALLRTLGPAGEPSSEQALDAEGRRIAARFGAGSLLPFQLDPDKRWYSAGGHSLVTYGRVGRTAVVLGDPIGPAALTGRAVRSFLEACRVRDWNPAFYQSSPAFARRLTRRGFRRVPIGREALVDLAGFTLDGSRRANLRHTVARAARGGLSVSWHGDGIPRENGALRRRLVEIQQRWQRRAGPQLGFTIHRFAPDELSRVMVSVASVDGTPVAFTTILFTGRDGDAVLDLMRRLPDSVPGAIESCLVEAVRSLPERGTRRLSLGLAPLSGLDPGSSEAAERWLARGGRIIRRFYDVDGLAFFKGKFDPRWETRYLVIRTWWHLPGTVLALLRLHLRGAWRELPRLIPGAGGKSPRGGPPESGPIGARATLSARSSQAR